LAKSKPIYGFKKVTSESFDTWFISKLVGQNFNESSPMAWKERQIAPQASAGYPLSINSLLAIRKAQRGLDKKASEK